MPISADEIKYLKNKHKGGKNNSKGNIYENYFSTYQIALLINCYRTQLSDVILTSQLENAFVDDLQIQQPSGQRNIYHQIKNVESLKWSSGKGKHTVFFDFKRQREISQEKNESFSLKLIYSNKSSTVKTIPSAIQNVTNTHYFPDSSSINQLILSCPEFKTAIINIANTPSPTDDELSGIASSILGAWCSLEQNHVSVENIVSYMKIMGRGYINIITDPSALVSVECINIFTRIHGFNYRMQGTILYWKYKILEGKVVWSEELDSKIQEKEPNSFLELLEII